MQTRGSCSKMDHDFTVVEAEWPKALTQSFHSHRVWTGRRSCRRAGTPVLIRPWPRSWSSLSHGMSSSNQTPSTSVSDALCMRFWDLKLAESNKLIDRKSNDQTRYPQPPHGKIPTCRHMEKVKFKTLSRL